MRLSSLVALLLLLWLWKPELFVRFEDFLTGRDSSPQPGNLHPHNGKEFTLPHNRIIPAPVGGVAPAECTQDAVLTARDLGGELPPECLGAQP